MGPSLSLWLYLTRARLADPGTAPAQPDAKRPGGPLIWLHSPGPDHGPRIFELCRQLVALDPSISVLVTHRPGQEQLTTRDPELPDIFQLELATEKVQAVRGMLNHWKPALGLFFSADLPPVPITEAQRQSVPLVLFSADAPESGVPEFPLRGRLANALIHKFARILLDHDQGRAAYRKLGIPANRLRVTGALAQPPDPLPVNEAERESIARMLAGRPSWLAMKVTAAELPMVLEAHELASRKAHRLLLFLAPAEPAQGPAIADELRAKGLHVALRSQDQDPAADIHVYIADVEGERGLWFRLSPITFLGQTMGNETPLDPFEPAALGSAVLAGPFTGTQAARFAQLTDAGAACEVRDGNELGQRLVELLSPDRAAQMAHAAWDVCTRGAEVSEIVAQELIRHMSGERSA